MKTCGNCGAQLDDNAKFCVGCGQPVADAAPEQQAPQQEAGPANYGAYQDASQQQYGQQAQQPYGQQAQQPYGQQPGAYNQYAQAPMSGMAIASLVLGLCSIFLNSLIFIPGILGIIFGAVGYSQCKKKGMRGTGLAIAGLVISIICTAIYVIATIYALSLASRYASYYGLFSLFNS